MKAFKRLFKVAMVMAALLFTVQVVMALVGMPESLLAWITAAEVQLEAPPRTIIVLGGGGIPSESGLIRTYYAARIATNNPQARVIVALPCDGDPENSSVGRMRDELVMRGVPRDAIRLEHRGLNTHQEAEFVRTMLGDAALSDPLLIVTSPYHARRSVMCFKKAGFNQVGCAIALNTFHEADIGGGGMLRYRFWSSLENQVAVVRELVAISYYRLRGRL